MSVNGPIAARHFGPDAPATGEDAEISLFGDALEIRGASGSERIPLRTLRLREVGSVSFGLEFSWDDASGTHAVQVSDASSVEQLLSHPTLSADPRVGALRKQRRKMSAGRVIRFSALALFLALPLLLLLIFFWQSDRIAMAIATRVPIEQERKLGEQTFEALRATLKLQTNGAAYDDLQTLGRRLTSSSAHSFQFHLANDAVVNAFALPGGIVVVNSGLIAATRRPEELAGVLAHEIQHVEQRHTLQAIVKKLGLRAVWMLITGDLSTGVMGEAALQLSELKFSRDAEAQADAGGFRSLVKLGIDPSGMADFFEVLEKQAVEPPPFLSTHPASASRAAALRSLSQSLGDRKFTPLDLGPWPPKD